MVERDNTFAIADQLSLIAPRPLLSVNPIDGTVGVTLKMKTGSTLFAYCRNLLLET